MKFRLEKLIPYFFLFFAWILFSSPSLFQGKIPLATDITVGMYYPWLDSGKVPIKNPILTDTVSQFWIWRQWAVDNLIKGHISLWNPYSLSGSYQSPWFHTILFSPINIFYFFLPKFAAISLIILSQLFFSLWFSYLLFFDFSKSKLASLLGSLAFSFSSYFIGWLTWGTVSWTLALLPLSLFLITKIFNKFRPVYLFLFFITQLFSLLGGHPQTYLYYLIIVFAFSIYKYFETKDKSKLIFTLITFVFSCAAASFVLLPSIKIINDSIRSQDEYIKSYNYGFVPAKDIITSAISPSFYGNPATNNYWGGPPNFQEKLFWFGIIPFTLAVFWIIRFIKNKHKSKFDYFLIIIFLLGIALSTKYPLGFIVYKLKVPLISSSPAGRGLILTIFSMVFMTVIAFKDILNKKTKYLSSSLITMAIIFALLYMEIAVFPHLSVSSSEVKIAFRNLSLSFAVFLTFCVLLIVGTKKYPKLLLLIPLLCFFDLFYFAKKYTPFNPSSYYFPQNKLLESLKSSDPHEFYRVEREKSELLPPNMWQAYSLHSTQGYDPITPKKYVNFLISKDLIKSPTRYIEWQNKDIPKLQNLGIKYFLTLKRDKDNHVSSTGSLDPVIDQKIWKTATESGSVIVLENKQFRFPYYLENNALLTLVQKTDDSWEFQSETKTPTKLIILENNHPAWLASIDGQSTPVLDFQSTFKQVDIPSGKHTIKVYFHDKIFVLGLYVSAISSILFLIYLASLSIYLKRR